MDARTRNYDRRHIERKCRALMARNQARASICFRTCFTPQALLSAFYGYRQCDGRYIFANAGHCHLCRHGAPMGWMVRVARMTIAMPFGAEFDSLSDMVAFVWRRRWSCSPGRLADLG